MRKLVVVLMTSRSGSSMVCRILSEHGLRWRDGNADPYQSASGIDTHGYRTYEHPAIKAALKSCIHKDPKKRKWPKGDMVATTNPRLDILKAAMGWPDDLPIDFVKSGVEFADLWQDWADLASIPITFIKVYRPPEDVAASLERRRIGSYQEGYDVAVKRLRLMDGIPGVTVATNMLIHRVDWGYSGIEDAVLSCGVEFDPDACRRAIEPEKFHA
jgi:hypothetical protein